MAKKLFLGAEMESLFIVQLYYLSNVYLYVQEVRTGGKHNMMPQREASESIHEQPGPTYGRYEGNQASSAYQHSETTYEQELREGPVGKVYPLPRDNKNVLRFALAVIAMVMLLLFGLLFVVFIGGTGGWISFAAASFAIFIIAAVGLDKIR
jgi:hypothetical protein